MQYIYQILAGILIGISLGAFTGDRRLGVRIPALIALACGALVFVLQAWWPLAAGIAVFLAGQSVQRDRPELASA